MSFQHWQEISSYLHEIEQEKNILEKNTMTSEGIDNTRKRVSFFLEQLKTSLEQKLDKNHAALILFAIVATVDEEMQGLDYLHLKVRWNPLQKDFFAAYTAGEVFFKTIDEILDDPTIPSMVYEVFYYMLKRGFQGKYRDSKTQLVKYLDLLAHKISVTQSHLKSQIKELVTPYLKKEKKAKWQYYGSAVVLFILVYFAIYTYSNFYQ
jgi:type IV/VI secretion system ImpK/VasF family protein